VFRAVLDANVYISAAIRPEGPPGQIIEGFLRKSAFELVVSPAIVDEVLRGLRYPKVTKYIRSEIEPEAWFLGIVLLADLVAGDYVLSRVSEDPDDDKYLAAAVEGRAPRLVTGDPDLLSVREHAGVRIVTPRAFLEALRESRRS
jgi:putative PIN family toxin of toxin-antitoxin system